MRSQICGYMQRTYTGIQTPTHRNEISRSTTDPSSVFPAQQILPPASSHCAFIPTKIDPAHGYKMIYFVVYLFLKLRDVKLR